MTQLPLNAKEFFTKNKPNHYVYRKNDVASENVLQSRDIMTVQTSQSITKIQPHLQPRVKIPPPPRKPVKQTNISSPKPKIQQCIYLVKITNSGCGCIASRECNNPACPLSIIRNGKKTQLNHNTCRQENCKWFTPK